MRKATSILPSIIILLAISLELSAQNGVAVSIRNGTSDPGSCQPKSTNVFINRSSTPVLKICTASNVWTTLLTSSVGVTGAASSQDNGVSRFDGLTGKTIQDSAWVINDSGGFNCATDGTCVIGNGLADPQSISVRSGGVSLRGLTSGTATITPSATGGDVILSANLGLGGVTPQKRLHILGPDGAVAVFPTIGGRDHAVLENNANAGIAIISGAASNGSLKFFTSGGAGPAADITYTHASGVLAFNIAASPVATITSTELAVPDGKYFQMADSNAGAPPAADCDNDAERGRLSIDTTNNRLYICNGATRGWDYAALTD